MYRSASCGTFAYGVRCVPVLEVNLEPNRYKSFISYASMTCDYASLVFEKNNGTQYIFSEEYSAISESILKKEGISVHPDTGSCFDNADILYIKASDEFSAFLKRADNMFEWNGNTLPEELCFYRNKKIWLTYISHEELLFIYNETTADIEFLKKNNINFLYSV